MRLLENFDQLSFLFGFLTGLLLFWLVAKFNLSAQELRQYVREQIVAIRQSLSIDIETIFRNEIVRYVQRNHLAYPLFSLDELIIPPRLLAPPPPSDPEGEGSEIDIVNRTLPYTPDWPEIPSLLGAPTLTLAQALQNGANLLLTGEPGSGKTIALAHLATQVALRDPQVNHLHNLVPVPIHAAELIGDVNSTTKHLEPICKKYVDQLTKLEPKKIFRFIENLFKEKRGLLLLDGLDELSRAEIDLVVDYLKSILASYPGNRVVAAASLDYFGGLPSAGLMPVAIAGWDKEQKKQFLIRWGQLWEEFIQLEIEASNGSVSHAVNPILLNNWLYEETLFQNPLELTLHTWAVYAGDLLGPHLEDAIRAYLKRMLNNNSEKLAALENLATQMVLGMKPVPRLSEAKKWARGNRVEIETPAPEPEEQLDIMTPEKIASQRVRRSIVNDLIEDGLLVERRGSYVSLFHPLFQGFLASQGIHGASAVNSIFQQPDWVGKSVTFEFLSARLDLTPIVRPMLSRKDVLHAGLFRAARWLLSSPEEANWRPEVLRQLVLILKDHYLSLGKRARAMMALVLSGDPGVVSLLRKFIQEDDPVTRRFATIGIGLLRDQKSLPMVTNVLNDLDPAVRRAAILALICFTGDKAMDAVASVLLGGDEDLQRASAEALQTRPKEGYAILQEASQIDDFLVRRASIFGLARIDEDWATEILQNMAVDDAQWVVRNAAAEAVASLEKSSPSIPAPAGTLHELPWLLRFASEQGAGVAPGKATEMLIRAARSGSEEQKIAALETLRFSSNQALIPILYETLYKEKGDLAEAAYINLMYLRACGEELPSPVKFGYQ